MTPVLQAQPERQDRPVRGRMAGVVMDGATGKPASGALVRAKLITENETFESERADGLGSYLVSDVPAGIYAVTVLHDGVSYRVADHFDVRMNLSFLLEACFELNVRRGTAALMPECTSGLYPERQIVSLGAHRYFRPGATMGSLTTVAAPAQALNLSHTGMSCVSPEGHAMIRATVEPPESVVSVRVYFRAPPDPNFFYIDLANVGASFQTPFPSPSPGTTELIYYLEGVDTSSERVQSNEFTVTVDSTCADPATEYFEGESPSIVIGTDVPGVTVTPSGFLPAGVTAFVGANGAVIPIAAAGSATPPEDDNDDPTALIIIIAAVGGAAITLGIVVANPPQASPVN